MSTATPRKRHPCRADSFYANHFYPLVPRITLTRPARTLSGRKSWPYSQPVRAKSLEIAERGELATVGIEVVAVTVQREMDAQGRFYTAAVNDPLEVKFRGGLDLPGGIL